MKFFRENTERKQVTVIVEEIFNPYNVFFFSAAFIKGALLSIMMLLLFQIISLREGSILQKSRPCVFNMPLQKAGRLLNGKNLTSQLHCARSDIPEGFSSEASGMIFYDASDLVCKGGIQATFIALFIIVKLITLSTPYTVSSPMIVDFFADIPFFMYPD